MHYDPLFCIMIYHDELFVEETWLISNHGVCMSRHLSFVKLRGVETRKKQAVFLVKNETINLVHRHVFT